MAKPLDLALEDHLLRARLDYVKTLKKALADPESEVSLALEVYTSIVDGRLAGLGGGWERGPAPTPAFMAGADRLSGHCVFDTQDSRGPPHSHFVELIDEIAADVADRVSVGLVRWGSGGVGRRPASHVEPGGLRLHCLLDCRLHAGARPASCGCNRARLARTQEEVGEPHNVMVAHAVAPPIKPKGPSQDVFGVPVNAMPIHPVACPSCGRHVAASRFAPHLEKCLLRGRASLTGAGRGSS